MGYSWLGAVITLHYTILCMHATKAKGSAKASRRDDNRIGRECVSYFTSCRAGAYDDLTVLSCFVCGKKNGKDKEGE